MIDLTEIEGIFDSFVQKGITELRGLQKQSNMEDDTLINAGARIIIGAMGQSFQAYESMVRASQIIQETEDRHRIALIDVAIKHQQELTEKIKNGNVTITYTYYADGVSGVTTTTTDITQVLGEILSVSYGTGTSPSLIDIQKGQALAQTSFVWAQEDELKRSVIFNNKLKTFNTYSDTLGNMGIGGFIIDAPKWTAYFEMLSDLYFSGTSKSELTVSGLSTTLVKA